MQIDTDVTGLFGVTLAIVALLVCVPRVRVLPLPRRAGWLAAMAIALSIPLWGVSPTGFVRGLTGDLSIAALVLLGLALVRSLTGRALVEEQNRDAMLRVILIAGLLFYPLALGLGMFDPYRLGYGNLWFMLALFGLSVWSILRYSTLLALCIASAVAAWSIGWYESTNLWDYLLDPWLAIYALVVGTKLLFASRKGKVHA